MPLSPDSTFETERPDPDFWGPPDRHDRNVRHERPPGLPAGPVGWGGPVDRLLDRVRDWRADPRIGVAALLVAALIAGVVWYRLGMSSSSADDSPTPRPAVSATAAPASVTSTPANTPDEVTVHVAGAVVSPGVYELKGSARVIDAIEAAGGGAPESDLDRLNLASKLVDGQRVLVQRVGDPAAPAATGTSPSGDPASTGVPGALVNVNTATQTELETLPGIGPTLAQAIIAERDRRGGFRAVNELRSVRGIGDKRFADIQALVTI